MVHNDMGHIAIHWLRRKQTKLPQELVKKNLTFSNISVFCFEKFIGFSQNNLVNNFIFQNTMIIKLFYAMTSVLNGVQRIKFNWNFG